MSRAAWIVVLVAPAVALVLLAARRGGLERLTRVRLRGAPWVVAAVGAQAVRRADPTWAAPVLHWRGGAVPTAVLAACAIGFAASTARGRRRGATVAASVLAAGALLNAAATFVNGGMPFSRAAARTAGISASAIASPPVAHRPIDGATRWPALADVVPVPGLHVVFSAGDVLLWAGVVALLVAAALQTPGVRAGGPRVDDPSAHHALPLEGTSP